MKEYKLSSADIGFLPQRDAVIGDYIKNSDTIVICDCGAVMRKSSFEANDNKCPECGKNKLININQALIRGFNKSTIQARRQNKTTEVNQRRNAVISNTSFAKNNPNSVNIGNRRSTVQKESTPAANNSKTNSINKSQQQRYLKGYDVRPAKKDHRSCIARILLFIVVALLFAVGLGVYTYFESGSVFGLYITPILNSVNNAVAQLML